MSGSETLPLVSSVSRGNSKKACDVLIVVPLLEDSDVSVDADDVMQDLTVLDIHSKSFKSETVGSVQYLADLCNGKKSVKLKDAREAFLQDLLSDLPKKGFTIRMFKSVDEDELFIRIILEDPNMEKHYAEQYRLRLQTTMEVMEKCNIVQDTNIGPVSPTYLDYDPEIAESLKKECGCIDLFRKYYTRSPEGSILRSVDRIRLIQHVLGKVFSLDRAVGLNVIKSHSPCHYKQSLHDLRKAWGNFTCGRLFDCTADQPLDLIRNYFGEQFGFYFAWCGLNIRIFGMLTFIGISIGIARLIWSGPDVEQILLLVWLAIMVGAGSYLTIGWKRCETWWAGIWDQLEMVSATNQARADYRGDFVPDPLNANGKKIRMYPLWKLRLAKLFTYTLTLVYMLLTVGLVCFIYYCKPLVVETFGEKWGAKVISIGISVQILICNKVWRKLTGFCVYLENPRTDALYYQAFIWKQFVFQFVNAYQSFLYILFVQPFRTGCPGEGANAFEICAEYAKSSLYTTFASYGFFAVLGMAQPYIMQQWALRSENKKIQKKLIAQGKSATDMPRRCFMETQGKMMEYPQEDQVADMLELVIVAGYVLLFGVLAPAVTGIALLFFLLRLRVDGWKLCQVVTRPYPTKATGLGEWNNVIDLLTWCGMAISVATMALKIQNPFGGDLGWKDRILAYFIVERVMMYIKLASEQAIEGKASWTYLMLQRREYVADRLMLGKAKDFPGSPPETAVFPARKEHATQFTVNDAEWPDVDHEDDKNDWGPLKDFFEDFV